jgi:Ecdysteroid kinase-like family
VAHQQLPKWQNLRLPKLTDDLNVELLNALVSEMHPGATVVGFEIGEVRRLGEMQVSTAGRVKLRLKYGPGSPPLPEQVLVKMVIDQPGVPAMLYETEVMIYQKFLPELDIQRPNCLAAAYDEQTQRFLLILEDLSVKGARFPNVLQPSLSPEQVGKALDLLATLHAKYWKSPKLEEERAWLGSLTEGKAFAFFDADTVKWIDGFVAQNSYRRDLMTRIGRSPARLWENVKAVHRYHEKIFPITLMHGDTGAHNTYHLPDGQVGFLDWQLSVRATWPHDVHYQICTALSVADRRAHEKPLVERYLARLAALGVSPREIPPIDLAMREVGRALIWGFTVGWLMVPERNYGMEIICANLERLLAACNDYRTFDLADEVTG